MDYYIKVLNNGLKHSYRVGIVIPIHNRAYYVQRCFASIKASQLKDALLILLDDASDEDTVRLIDGFAHRDATIIKVVRMPWRKSSAERTLPFNLSFTFNYLLANFTCRYFCILDSDTLVRPYWLDRLCSLHEDEQIKQDRPIIVSGFNTLYHPFTVSDLGDRVYKRSLGGVNMLFTPDLYGKIMLPFLKYWDENVVKRMREKSYPMICTRPSVVQHIGYRGSFSNGYLRANTAFDYGSPICAQLIKMGYILLSMIPTRLIVLIRSLRDGVRQLFL